MKILGIIPARYASTRFPGKPLADIDGKTMIQRVYSQALKSAALNNVVVATDDERIVAHVESFGGKVLMTSPDHENGTSRCHEAVLILKSKGQDYDAVINIQGDEPYIDPAQIDMVSQLLSQRQAAIATLVKEINSTGDLFNENVVKVVVDNKMNALYFSRQPIPFVRGTMPDDWAGQFVFYKHIGIYGYRTRILGEIVKLNQGKLETAEKLEQLRWLENSYVVAVDVTEIESLAIDTPGDLLKLSNKG